MVFRDFDMVFDVGQPLEKASPFLGLDLLSSYLVKESLILLHHGSERTTPPTNCQGKSQEDLLLIPFQRKQKYHQKRRHGEQRQQQNDLVYFRISLKQWLT